MQLCSPPQRLLRCPHLHCVLSGGLVRIFDKYKDDCQIISSCFQWVVQWVWHGNDMKIGLEGLSKLVISTDIHYIFLVHDWTLVHMISSPWAISCCHNEYDTDMADRCVHGVWHSCDILDRQRNIHMQELPVSWWIKHYYEKSMSKSCSVNTLQRSSQHLS